MSLLQGSSGVRLPVPSIRPMAGRVRARLVLSLRRRAARLLEDAMPDWQARDLGFRDGRATIPRKTWSD